MKMGGQIRAIEGAVLGWDMCAALQMADAIGHDKLAVVELLPEVEEVACRKVNERSAQDRSGSLLGDDDFGEFG